MARMALQKTAMVMIDFAESIRKSIASQILGFHTKSEAFTPSL